jgi:putative transcriptional regulator
MQDLKGKILVSPPHIGDRRFSQSVVLVVDHTDSHSWGLMLNRPIAYTNDDIMRRLNLDYHLPGRCHLGGPVNNHAVHILHDGALQNSDSQEVMPGVWINSDMGFLISLASMQPRGEFRMFVGCSSWTAGQLEGEIGGQPPWQAEHSWLVAEVNSDFVMGLNQEDQWQQGITMAAQQITSGWLS